MLKAESGESEVERQQRKHGVDERSYFPSNSSSRESFFKYFFNSTTVKDTRGSERYGLTISKNKYFGTRCSAMSRTIYETG